MSPGNLQEYNKKRDFQVTPEPPGDLVPDEDEQLRFVIQKHDATRLHYDFRLELDGVLKSWAVTKGPSYNRKDKRLAVRTEDHPLSYGDFEGIIPEGQYGAGTVIVWDRGTYRNLTRKDGEEVPIEQALREGHVKVWLEGEKLHGGYALTRVIGNEHERWLLVKVKDEHADGGEDPVKTCPHSVRSGKTLAEIAKFR